MPVLVVQANVERFRCVPDSTCFLRAFHKHALRIKKRKTLLAKKTTPLGLEVFEKCPHIFSNMTILLFTPAGSWKSE